MTDDARNDLSTRAHTVHRRNYDCCGVGDVFKYNELNAGFQDITIDYTEIIYARLDDQRPCASLFGRPNFQPRMTCELRRFCIPQTHSILSAKTPQKSAESVAFGVLYARVPADSSSSSTRWLRLQPTLSTPVLLVPETRQSLKRPGSGDSTSHQT